MDIDGNENHMESKWLERKFLEWQVKLGRSATKKEFAEYLGVEYSLFVKHFHGERKPGLEYVAIYAEQLGDDSIYDIAGYKRPDPLLEQIRVLYDEIPPENRKRVVGEALKVMREALENPYFQE